MIALAILAMGLLVIGAALPIGLRYTRESINLATGQAAAENALDLIEQNVCLPKAIFDASGNLIPEAGLFQPRAPITPTVFNGRTYAQGEFIPDYEAVVKVRPVYTRVVDMTGAQDDGILGVFTENEAGAWLLNFGTPLDAKEVNPTLISWMRWALPCVALVYPPITPNARVSGGSTEYMPAEFFGAPYTTWPVGAETRKVLDSLISWTAFYRRVSYDVASDTSLYEFIAVAVRRPSLKYRFPVQSSTSGGGQVFARLTTIDTAIPIPWLISFVGDASGYLPAPASGFDINNGFPPIQGPATLTFYCDPSMTGLLPVGSVFIPARNDVVPPLVANPAQRVGFGPPAPTTLPIYEVVQRPNDGTVVVKYNGYYPMQGTVGTYGPVTNPLQWPVWVIPPAYEELSGGSPVFPDRSPILAVARRYVRLREIP